jgi:hypothetical protein
MRQFCSPPTVTCRTPRQDAVGVAQGLCYLKYGQFLVSLAGGFPGVKRARSDEDTASVEFCAPQVAFGRAVPRGRGR